MDITELVGWGSPVGLGVFLAGAGVFFWGLYWLRRPARERPTKDPNEIQRRSE